MPSVSEAVPTTDRYRLLGHPTDLAGHVATLGPVPLPSAATPGWREAFVSMLESSGLAGRGGAGFPAAIKLAVAHAAGRGGTILVNAMEGEPSSDKDKLLLIRSPHLVLDGAQLMAAATGARRIAVCVPDGRRQVVSAVSAAMAERVTAGCAPVLEVLVRPPDRFVAGEESALARWVESGQSLPSFRPDKGIALRIGRKGALVHNAETLAHVAMIARTGPDAFRAHGLVEDPGTSLVTISGAVAHPGVVEIDRGTPLIDIVNRATPTDGPQALLVGGYGGAWVGPGPLHDALRVAVPAGGRSDGRRRHCDRARRRWLWADGVGADRALPGGAKCGPVRAVCLRAARHRRRPDPAGPRALRARPHGPSRPKAPRGRRPGGVPASGRCRQPRAQRTQRLRPRRELARPRRTVPTLESHDPAPVPSLHGGGRAVIRILIDPIACDAYGYCAELLPEAITLDEWGYPIVDGKPLPTELFDAAKRAARDCPRRAITLRQRKGGL